MKEKKSQKESWTDPLFPGHTDKCTQAYWDKDWMIRHISQLIIVKIQDYSIFRFQVGKVENLPYLMFKMGVRCNQWTSMDSDGP